MLNDQQILAELRALPPERQAEVLDFIEFMKQKDKKQANIKAPRQFGMMKGLVTHMAEDFDAPLDDFEEYMS